MSRANDVMANLMKAKQIMDKTDAENPIRTAAGKTIQTEGTQPPQYQQPRPQYQQPQGNMDGREVGWGSDTSGNMLSEAEMVASGNVPPRSNLSAPPQPQMNQITNSRLPDNIKKAMMENPIPQATMPSNTFSLEQMQQYMNQNGMPQQPQYQQPQYQQPQPQYQQPIVEQIQQQQPNISEQVIRKMVNEEVQKYFAKYFMKTMTETVNRRIKKK